MLNQYKFAVLIILVFFLIDISFGCYSKVYGI